MCSRLLKASYFLIDLALTLNLFCVISEPFKFVMRLSVPLSALGVKT